MRGEKPTEHPEKRFTFEHFLDSHIRAYPLLSKYGLEFLLSSIGPGELLDSFERGIKKFLETDQCSVDAAYRVMSLITHLLTELDFYLLNLRFNIEAATENYLGKDACVKLANSIFLTSTPHKFFVFKQAVTPGIAYKFEYSSTGYSSIEYINKQIEDLKPKDLLVIGRPPIFGLVSEIFRTSDGKITDEPLVNLYFQMKSVLNAVSDVLKAVMKNENILVHRINHEKSHGNNTGYLEEKLKSDKFKEQPMLIRIEDSSIDRATNQFTSEQLYQLVFYCSYNIYGIRGIYDAEAEDVAEGHKSSEG